MYAACKSVFASRGCRARTVRLSQMIEASSCSQELYTRVTQNVSQMAEAPSSIGKMI